MRTRDELEDQLDEDLAWRRVELQSLLATARAAKGIAQVGLCRAGVALLYAHWEGFAKHSLTSYLRYVSRRRLLHKELQPGFVALSVDSYMNRQSGLSSARHRNMLTRRILTCGDERAWIPAQEVSTSSNLNSEVCFDLLDTLGLDSAPFATRAHLIDYKLLRARNEIAHGRYSAVAIGDYEELQHEVLLLIDTLRNIVLTAADTAAYRRGS